MDSGVTTLFVSHDSGAIKTLCKSAVMIHDGQIYTKGLPNAVTIEYLKLVTDLELGLSVPDLESEKKEQIDTDKKKDNISQVSQNNSTESSISEVFSTQQYNAKQKRRGSGKARIEKINLLNHLGENAGESPVFGFNEEVTLAVNIKAYEPLQSCIIGFFICDKNGNEVIGSNTLEENIKIGNLEKDETLDIFFKFHLPLRTSSYSFTVAGSENYESLTFDWIDNAMVFQVLPPDNGKRVHALVDQPMEVQVKKCLYQ